MEGAGEHCVVWNKTSPACFPHLQYLDALKYKLDNKKKMSYVNRGIKLKWGKDRVGIERLWLEMNASSKYCHENPLP